MRGPDCARSCFFFCLALCLFASPSVLGAGRVVPEAAIDWPAFLQRQDLVWEETPRQWNEGAFIGNGQLGAMVYATLADNRLDFHFGRVDVTDHRGAPDRQTSFGVPGANVMYDFPRLDIGRLALRPAGKIESVTMRLDLWNAELRGKITTSLGGLEFRAIALRDCMVQIIEVVSTEKQSDGQPAPWSWQFLPGNADSPRAQVFPDRPESLAYESNPEPEFVKSDGIDACVQTLLAGGDYATAWLERRDGDRGVIFVSTANEVPASGRSAEVAADEVRSAADASLDDLVAAHRRWWHAFYGESFLSIPDTRLEAFYWAQIYKMGAATREEGPALDLAGPWFRINQWPGMWWNLNIQLTYWPFLASNHLELGRTFIEEIDRYFDALLVMLGGRKLGDLAWALHNYWLHYRYEGDDEALAEKWRPKAERVAREYLGLLAAGPDGRLHLPTMESPEYWRAGEDRMGLFADSNYNLALLRWLLTALLDVDPDNTDSATWRAALDNLADPPVGEDGLMIGADQPVDASHRHYSHLVSFYPLHFEDLTDPSRRDLLRRSLDHWLSVDDGEKLTGYSWTGAAAMFAALGDGNRALAMLNRFLDGPHGRSLLLPNTFYVETGGRNPTIETPLTVASTTIELLLQSHGGVVRVFPAVPGSWREAVFSNLRAQGGFLVSAVRQDGVTKWVRIRSLAGEPLRFRADGWQGPLKIVEGQTNAIREEPSGDYEIQLDAGEKVVLSHQSLTDLPPVRRVTPQKVGAGPFFGLPAGRGLPKDLSWPEPARPSSGQR